MKKIKIIVALAAGVLSGMGAIAQKNGVSPEAPNGWYLLDRNADGYFGISLDKAYEWVKDKSSTTILVAVIDSGVDTTHEDLRAHLWRNPADIPGNGIDDDRNGYTDDVYGWNFLGGKDGRNVGKDSYEAVRVYHQWKGKYMNNARTDTLHGDQLAEYKMWRKAGDQIRAYISNATGNLSFLQSRIGAMHSSDSLLRKGLGRKAYTGAELEKYVPQNEEEKKARILMLSLFKEFRRPDLDNGSLMDGVTQVYNEEKTIAGVLEQAPEDFRAEIVKDNYFDASDCHYGNNDVMGNATAHGTHVAGIIGAIRKNGIGMDGVADNVRIMIIRVVPDGDEHDKDIANAIRYAVDNKARIINMSFDKEYSPQKKWVDNAVKYAESKDVLIIHAAGNDGEDLDSSAHFPNPDYGNNPDHKAGNWITVGASGDPALGGLAARFSNYGEKEVDVFAPGVKIFSTLPGGNRYGNMQGTSMAAPVVSGLAAFILAYYPTLSARQLKYVIEHSVQKPDSAVKKPGTEQQVDFGKLCKTGGIVNAFEAIKLASLMKGEHNMIVREK